MFNNQVHCKITGILPVKEFRKITSDYDRVTTMSLMFFFEAKCTSTRLSNIKEPNIKCLVVFTDVFKAITSVKAYAAYCTNNFLLLVQYVW